jgi:NADH-quinone oxidoreductase subunit C
MSTIERLNSKFAGEFSASVFRGQQRIAISSQRAPALLFDLLSFLLHDCGFDYLCDVAGIDYLNYPDAVDRYGVVYSLTNSNAGERLFVKAFANDPEPELPSVVSLWRGADWMEREVYDMFGVQFIGHPDLRRILMPEESMCFPLRKDYPLRGHGERHNFPTVTRSES